MMSSVWSDRHYLIKESDSRQHRQEPGVEERIVSRVAGSRRQVSGWIERGDDVVRLVRSPLPDKGIRLAATSPGTRCRGAYSQSRRWLPSAGQRLDRAR